MAFSAIYDRKTFGPGTLLIRPGEPAHHAYLVQSGRARVFAVVGGEQVDLAEVGAGEIVGDMALIRKSRHHYGVEATETLIAVVVSVPHIQDLLDRADPLLRTILRGLVDRVDRLNQEKSPDEVWFV